MSEQRYQFGEFTLDLFSGQLLRDSEEISVRPKSFQVLTHLVQNAGKLVSKQELLEAIWPDLVVTDDTLTQCLVELRRALGDTDQSVITTVPRRGYRFDIPPSVPAVGPAERGRTTVSSVKIATRVGVMIIAFLAAVWSLQKRESSTPKPAGQEPVVTRPLIAITPFVNATGRSDNDFLATSLEDAIYRELMATEGVRVMRVGGERPQLSIDEANALFGSRFLVQGELLQRDPGKTFEISVVELPSTVTVTSSTHLLSETGLLQISDHVLLDLAKALNLDSRSTAAGNDAEAIDPVVYRAYLRAKFMLDSADNYWEQIPGLLKFVIEQNPNFAPVWREQARFYFTQLRSSSDPQALVVRINASLDRAFEIDSNDAATLAYLGWHKADFDREDQTAARLMSRAVATTPHDEDVIRTAGIFALYVGDFEAAIRLARVGSEKNPLCMRCHYTLLLAYLAAEQWEDAEATATTFGNYFGGARTSIGLAMLYNNKPQAAYDAFTQETSRYARLMGQYMSLSSLGEQERADKILDELAQAEGDNNFWAAGAWAHAREYDKAFITLQKAVDASQTTQDGEVVHWNSINIGSRLNLPLFRNLRDDPRWSEFKTRNGLFNDDTIQLAY